MDGLTREDATADGGPEAAVGGFWQRFAQAAGEQEFYAAWLGIQCAQVGGCKTAVVFHAGADGLGASRASWPSADVPDDVLRPVAAEALRRGHGVVQPLRTGPSGHDFAIAFPVRVDDQHPAVIALTVVAPREEDLQRALRALQWGAGWLEALTRRRQLAAETARNDRMAAALYLTSLAVSATSLREAARAVVTEMASRLRCERVSIGLYRSRRCRVLAVSHSADFAPHSNLAQAMEAAMDEAADQLIVVRHPPLPGDAAVSRAHAALARTHGAQAVLSVPLLVGESVHGALTLEGPEPLAADAVALVRAVAELTGPILYLRARAEVSGIRRLRESGRERLSRLWGAGHYTLKLAGALTAAVLIALVAIRLPYKVGADTDVEGVVRRVMGAPQDGYIAKAPVRAGDEVRAGEELARLDDTELRLKLLSWQSQVRQLELDLSDARARHDRARAGVAEALIEQAAAEVSLLEMQVARTVLRAPFDAVVVAGDLSQSLGRPVRQGEVMFELAPLDRYRVILNVDERDVAYVRAGQLGTLVLTALPGKTFPFTVERVTPVAVAQEGRNFFRAEAKIEAGEAALRPGMSGVGKVETDRRSLLWIWTHGLVDWLRLKLWRFIP